MSFSYRRAIEFYSEFRGTYYSQNSGQISGPKSYSSLEFQYPFTPVAYETMNISKTLVFLFYFTIEWNISLEQNEFKNLTCFPPRSRILPSDMTLSTESSLSKVTKPNPLERPVL